MSLRNHRHDRWLTVVASIIIAAGALYGLARVLRETRSIDLSRSSETDVAGLPASATALVRTARTTLPADATWALHARSGGCGANSTEHAWLAFMLAPMTQECGHPGWRIYWNVTPLTTAKVVVARPHFTITSCRPSAQRC
jgi:hypothetical protein